MRLLHPSDPEMSGELGDNDLAHLYAYPDTSDRWWLRANFVTTLDGSVQGPDQRSGSISDEADQRIFAMQRSLTDVILCGAGTARAEGYRPVRPNEAHTTLRSLYGLSPLPAIAVVSRSLDLDPELVRGAAAPTIVITVESAPAERMDLMGRLAPIIVAGHQDVDLAQAVERLYTRGYRRMLCEGGPTLMRGLLAADVVDELTLTIAPSIVGGDRLHLTHGPALDPPRDLSLTQLLGDGATLFARYAVRSGAT